MDTMRMARQTMTMKRISNEGKCCSFCCHGCHFQKAQLSPVNAQLTCAVWPDLGLRERTRLQQSLDEENVPRALDRIWRPSRQNFVQNRSSVTVNRYCLLWMDAQLSVGFVDCSVQHLVQFSTQLLGNKCSEHHPESYCRSVELQCDSSHISSRAMQANWTKNHFVDVIRGFARMSFRWVCVLIVCIRNEEIQSRVEKYSWVYTEVECWHWVYRSKRANSVGDLQYTVQLVPKILVCSAEVASADQLNWPARRISRMCAGVKSNERRKSKQDTQLFFWLIFPDQQTGGRSFLNSRHPITVVSNTTGEDIIYICGVYHSGGLST